MRTLNRLLLLVLSVALVATVWIMHLNMTRIEIGHETFYHIRWPWLQNVRDWSLFGALAWCLIFAQSETTFVRIGLVAVIVALVVMLVPLRFH